MDKQFTASEVRATERHFRGSVGNGLTADMLHAYADLLEAQEKTVPVAWWNKRTGQILRPHELDAIPDAPHPHSYFKEGFVPLTAHSAPADADGLAEALLTIQHSMQQAQIHGNDSRREIKLSAAVCEQALAAHSAQAQPPAASVTDAIRSLVNKWRDECDSRDVNDLSAIGRQHARRTCARELEATLAAQENPNG